MRRLLFIPLLTACVLLASCGATFVGFVSNPGKPTQVSGTISKVQLGSIESGPGAPVTITTVTFINAGVVTTVGFCGDQQNLFPMNQFVRADFTVGIYCSTLTGATATG